MIAETKTTQTELKIPPPAINFVKIDPEISGCGRYASGAWDILKTTHPNKTILVKILTKWKYENRWEQEVNNVSIAPNTTINLGCDFWRGDFELQEFDRKIVDAFYLT